VQVSGSNQHESVTVLHNGEFRKTQTEITLRMKACIIFPRKNGETSSNWSDYLLINEEDTNSSPICIDWLIKEDKMEIIDIRKNELR
jgi:hypothetical protein